nr:putative alpha methylacyl-CoA racemase [Colletotrichum truncatum]KAF6782074.1 putative alpha methylacyl-CoA racemase [Colletotrichum truncatum]
MNPEPTLTALGLPMEGDDDDSYDAVVQRFQNVVSQLDSAALDELMNEQYRQAGSIAYTTDEYFATEQGQQCAKVGLYELSKDTRSSQPPGWWPEVQSQATESSSIRPLAGLKVVDLTRVIAGPAVTRGLAELDASVMRVTSPNITDLSAVHQDLNWGKWNCHLNIKNPEDQEKLRELIREADVVVDGYRPGVMERHGLGRQAIFDLVRDRSRGIIHVRENCYGWHGPWSHRSGWQQISDICCGVSIGYGKAMGHDEAVTPVFPNSDYCTGVCGSAAVLDALVKRAEQGGSYGIDVALNYYSGWLVRSCGMYPDDVWNEVWQRHGSPVFRKYHSMLHLLPSMMKLLKEHDAATLFNPDFFEARHAKNMDTTFVQVKPIAQFNDQSVQLGYHVGTRGNGVDYPRWPKDLSVETVQQDN